MDRAAPVDVVAERGDAEEHVAQVPGDGDLVHRARDLEGIELTDILQAVRDERRYDTWLLWRARTEPAADEIANSLEAGMRERISGMTLRELASRPALP